VKKEDLILKVISGNASSAEKKSLDVWLNISEENQQMFNQQKLIWQMLGTTKKEVKVDVDNAWSKFELRKETTKNGSSKFLYRIAAILIVVISVGSIGTYLFFGNQNSNLSQIAKAIIKPSKKINNSNSQKAVFQANNTENEKPSFYKRKKVNKETDFPYVEYVLNDSSTVKLNDNGALKFLDYSSNNSRVASLIGAGVFDIKPSNQLFVLETDEIIIHVEGTKFNVSPNNEKNCIEISVEEGRMDVYDKNNLNNSVALTAGQNYIFDIQKREFIQLKIDVKQSKWKKFWKNFGKK
jgi:transmembrane sensor